MTTKTSHLLETTSRLVQWRINDFPSSNYKPTGMDLLYLIERSDAFTIGKWNWCLRLAGKNQNLVIALCQDIPESDDNPIVSFNIRVISLLSNRKTFIHQEIRDRNLLPGGFFVWDLNDSLTGRFIIDVEFLDLKIASPNGGEPRSIWSVDFTQKDTNLTTLSSLGRMLSESIHTDITIHASDGSIEAHRAVLAARSPVFHSMFLHDLKEKEMSIINISDMSIEACKAFLNYIYSTLQYQDFHKHRLDLLRAGDKYDMPDLKDICEESLIEDIDMKNVLERLQTAYMIRLTKLKVCCMQYLVKFRKIFFIREEFDAFMKYADRELVGEVFNEILSVW